MQWQNKKQANWTNNVKTDISEAMKIWLFCVFMCFSAGEVIHLGSQERAQQKTVKVLVSVCLDYFINVYLFIYVRLYLLNDIYDYAEVMLML